VAVGAWVLRVRRHQALLDCEDQVVCGIERCRRQGWVSAAEPDLKGADRLAQVRRRLIRVVQAKHLDVFEEEVGVSQQHTAV